MSTFDCYRSTQSSFSRVYLCHSLNNPRCSLKPNYLLRVFCLFIPDLLAVPDFLNGAMEEWGLVVFRRALLVYDEQFTSTDAKVKMTKVIAHELAHQVSPLYPINLDLFPVCQLV